MPPIEMQHTPNVPQDRGTYQVRVCYLPKNSLIYWVFLAEGGGIRTHGDLTTTPVFKTGAFNRSATPPLR